MKLKKICGAALVVFFLTGCNSPEKVGRELDEQINAGNYTQAREMAAKYVGKEKYDSALAATVKENAMERCERLCKAENEDEIEKTGQELDELCSFNFKSNSQFGDEAKKAYLEQFEGLYTGNADSNLIGKRLEVLGRFVQGEPEDGFFESSTNRVLNDIIAGTVKEDKAAEVFGVLSAYKAGNLSFLLQKTEDIYGAYNKGELNKASGDIIFNALDKGFGEDAIKAEVTKYNALVQSKNSFDLGVKAMNEKKYDEAKKCFEGVISEDLNYTKRESYLKEIEEKAEAKTIDSKALTEMISKDPYVKDEMLKSLGVNGSLVIKNGDNQEEFLYITKGESGELSFETIDKNGKIKE